MGIALTKNIVLIFDYRDAIVVLSNWYIDEWYLPESGQALNLHEKGRENEVTVI